MKNIAKVIFFVFLGATFIILLTYLATKGTLAVLEPAGQIADKQRNLMAFALVLMMIIIIPVFGMTAYIAWRYREGNNKATYKPEWDSNKLAESIWWGFPIAIILALSVVTWTSSHELDPFQPLKSEAKPLEVQVIALDWKWLFIYPDQQIATVNYLKIPKNTPINLSITSDAPMNSFWVPQLGGQIYAMPGMNTQLHLEADEEGTYQGSSANLSGEGFAGMRFTTEAVSGEEFDNWVASTKSGDTVLNTSEYDKLSQPSKNNPPTTYASVEPKLFQSIIDKFLVPASAVDAQNRETEHVY